MSEMLTLEWLQAHDACKDAQMEFRRLYPGGAAPLHEVVAALAEHSDGVLWFERLLEYHPALKPHRAAYDAVENPAWAAYAAAVQPAWAAYAAARRDAWAAYDAALQPAWAAFEAARRDAWAAFEAARRDAWAAYEAAVRAAIREIARRLAEQAREV